MAPPRIKPLSADMIDKIAAGEVVERPANALKELVENALDAGALQINVALEEGGRQLIVVEDDGQGIPPGDAEWTVRRHATSKIRDVEGLYEVASHGFRGEALATLSAVSRFTLTSATRDGEGEGFRLRRTGEGEPEIEALPARPGTRVAVADLFFNLPARKKFLRSPATEWSQCAEYLQALALAHPEVGFRLSHNGREKMAVPALSGLEGPQLGPNPIRQRLEALGIEAGDFLYGQAEDPSHGRVEALLSPPGAEKAHSRHMWLFLNRRWVKDKMLRYGVMRGYHSHLLKGRFPQVALYVDVHPTLVDVNVHPTKAEVRFQYPSEVQGLIAQALRTALRGASEPLPSGPPPASALPPAPVKRAAGPIPSAGPRPAAPARAKETVTNWNRFAPSPLMVPPPAAPPSTSVPTGSAAPQEDIPWAELRYVGTILSCYLLLEGRDRVLVVDQHAFHERILYEDLKARKPARQALVVPEVVELPAAAVVALNEKGETLRALGFAGEARGETSYAVTAVPTVVTGANLAELIAALGEQLGREGGIAGLGEVAAVHDLYATVACHSAVRAGSVLSDAQRCQLLAAAAKVDFYHHCPHGRRVFSWLDKRRVEGWFDRV